MTYRAPLDDIGFALKYGAALGPGDRARPVRRPFARRRRCGAGGGRPLRRRSHRAAQSHRRHIRHAVQGRRRHHGAGLEGSLPRLAAGRLECGHRAGAMGRPGSAADRQCRLHRNVARGLDRLRQRSDADHGGDRRARRPRQRHAQAHLSGKAGVRRMDGHDAAHRAAGRLRRRRVAHARRARRRRQLSPQGPEDLHHLRRARFHRQHHPFRAGAPARCAARHARHFAVSGAEILAATPTARSARATTSAPIRSSTSSASTARRPAP